jgi:hypothetical protein
VYHSPEHLAAASRTLHGEAPAAST